MKRLIIALIASGLFAIAATAQDAAVTKDYYRQSVHAGYGIMNEYSLKNKDDINNLSGVLSLGYEYRPVKMLGLGADIGWMKNTGTHRGQVDYPGGVSLPYSTPFKTDYFLISANVRGIWVDIPYFCCYSGIRAGLTLKSEDRTCTGEAHFQLIPVGIEAGVQCIRAYAEFAIGCPRNLSLGIRFHF